MEPNRHSYDDHTEEDYIDMDVNSQSTIFIHTKTSSPQFEFQMSSSSDRDDSLPSPADELFYKGNLLPLHLPPRLQMVAKLLKNTSTYDYKISNALDESFSTPLFTPTYNSPTSNTTPFESCLISPNDSRQVSGELNPEDYFLQYSNEMMTSEFIRENPKKSWTKKFLGTKLKASRSYLKSLFNKSACSNENSAIASKNNTIIDDEAIFKTKESSSRYIKVSKKAPFGQIQRTAKQETFTRENFLKGTHRRSFSGVMKRMSIPRASSSISSSGSSSSSSSTNSNGFKEKKAFKRSNSVGSEAENPIQAAIAHCKKSQELMHSRKALSDFGICSLSSSLVKYEDQRLVALCRG